MRREGSCSARTSLGALSVGAEAKANVFLVRKCECMNKFFAVKRMTREYNMY